ncbi:hypothetical protein GXW78_11905 [Roseomonas terrae]|uniref:Phage head morphogenesis domain-containing protein n=1 Tax=Neoroseomonas terrae TaxID=424799 RepID=A0ABS5EH63_9PROT|nr:hypothetical protein [Neoroseomonas terrae]MBR0650370.1 hypothetical protein [Neoroseomonas terrae]
MTDKERRERFQREREARLKAGIRIQRDTSGEVRRLLLAAEKDIMAVLAGQPSDYRRWQLTELQRQIARILAMRDEPAAAMLGSGLSASWNAGVALIDAPLLAGGVDLSASLMALDVRNLAAMRSFTTDRIKDVTAKVANRINDQLANTMMGLQSPWEAAEKVSGLLRDDGMRRANTIVRTNLGQAYSAAAQARQEQAAEIVPGMQKQWRRSGKLHSRYGHDFIDGQVRDVDKPFDLPNGVKLMYPRDPAGPIGEVINCGCVSLPFMSHWSKSKKWTAG